ncbi:MAG: hypothetical protein GEU28_13145, partial [Dehalococcoidia bacterium]|nr:hypothetical protein [Dehalococcoidia bacterium]
MNATTSTLNLLAALTYAGRGWRPFRLAPRAKVPLKGSHGFKDATTDTATIRTWWDEEPRANVGIATGELSNIVVIESDPRNGGDETLRDLEAEHGDLPETVRALSGRQDGGTHYYFRHPGFYIKSGADRLGPGLDVKADGAYVVAPPSIHPKTGKEYEWDAGAHPADVPLADLPDWMLARLTETKTGPASTSETDDWTIPEGQRNAGLLSIAGRLRRQAFNEEEIAGLLLVTNRHRCVPPLPEVKSSASP